MLSAMLHAIGKSRPLPKVPGVKVAPKYWIEIATIALAMKPCYP